MSRLNVKSVLITGASAGIGREVARQLALKRNIESIYLAVRNKEKGNVVQRELEQKTNRTIFHLITLDLTDLDSVRAAVSSLPQPIDAVVLNAGGSGGKTPMALNGNGVTHLMAQNVLGHMALLEGLLKSGKLTQTAVFLGSEAARGVPKMQIKRPTLPTSSVDEFSDIITGKVYAGKKLDIFSAYGEAKFVGVLWMSSLARQYPNLRLLSISPGGTKGTEAASDLSPLMRFFYNYIFQPIIGPLLGLVHSLETGSQRIADGLADESLLSGHFYGSKANVLVGPLVDQSEIFADLGNTTVQDHASEALHRFA